MTAESSRSHDDWSALKRERPAEGMLRGWSRIGSGVGALALIGALGFLSACGSGGSSSAGVTRSLPATETTTSAQTVTETQTETARAEATTVMRTSTVSQTVTETAPAVAVVSQPDEESSTQWGWIAFGVLAFAVLVGGIVWLVRRKDDGTGGRSAPA